MCVSNLVGKFWSFVPLCSRPLYRAGDFPCPVFVTYVLVQACSGASPIRTSRLMGLSVLPTKLEMSNRGFNQPTPLLYPVILPLFSFRRVHCVRDFSVLWIWRVQIILVLGSHKSILGKYSRYLTVFKKNRE